MSVGAPCPGCGVVLTEYEGPTHPYIGASAACWALYGELLAHEYAEIGFPECHRLTVDAYAVQHPGRRNARSIKTLGSHLCGLYLVLDRRLDGPAATALKNRVVAADPGFVWLNAPRPDRALTVADVLEMRREIGHTPAIEAWAQSVWEGWKIHHGAVRDWVEGTLEKVA